MHPKRHNYLDPIAPYKPLAPIESIAKKIGKKPEDIIQLCGNENPYGMSPKVQEAIFKRAHYASSVYPEIPILQEAIAKHHSINTDNVIPGNGSCEVLELAAKAFMNPDFSSLYSQHSFVMYKLATQYMGGECIAVPTKENYQDDLDSILKNIRENTKIIWLASIGNPTSVKNSYKEIEDFIKKVPQNIVIVLDEAYSEYLPDKEQVDTSKWIDIYPNLLITHSFSKIYGLAGLRIGYGVASKELANNINLVRGPYNCNHLAILAGTEALKDQSYIKSSRQKNQKGIRQLKQGLDDLGYEYLPPSANFITFKVKDQTLVEKLLRQGIIIAPLGGYEMPKYARISVGTEENNAKFIEVLSFI